MDKPINPQPAAGSFPDAFLNADEALKLLRAHGLAPIPKNYAVFYAYTFGAHEPLARCVDRLIERSCTISDYDLAEIFEQHLRSDESPQDQGRLQQGVESEVETALSHLKEGAARNERFTILLDEVEQELPNVTAADNLEGTVLHLARENRIMAHHSRELATKLNASHQKIRELNEMLNAAQRQSREDPMTGLANRRAFDAEIALEAERAVQCGTSLCLALCDLDHFKQVNDRFGHVVGDSVIRHFSGLLRQMSGSDFFVARYGGEEFAILMPDQTVEAAAKFCERIRARLESTRLIVRNTRQQLGAVTASFGIGRLVNGRDADELIRNADKQLYRAKRGGRNQVCFGP